MEKYYTIKKNGKTIVKKQYDRSKRVKFYLTQEAITKLLNYIKEKGKIRDYLIFKTMYLLALRVEETLKIKVEDISLINGVPILEIKEHKTKRIKGTSDFVPLDPNLYNELKIFMGKQKKGYLFLSNRNKIIERTTITKLFRKYCKEAGIDNPDPYAKYPYPRLLRRSRGQHLREKGYSIEFIASVLRDSLNVAFQSYSKPTPQSIFNKLYKEKINDNKNN